MFRARSVLPLSSALLLLLVLAASPVNSRGQASNNDSWSSVQNILGFQGKIAADGVLRIDLTRNLSVSLNGTSVKPELVSNGFISLFRPQITAATPGMNTDAGMALATGDIPLLEDEVQTFVQALERGGVTIPAIHNELIRETPRLIFVHLEFAGDPAQFATTTRAALNQTGGGFIESTGQQAITRTALQIQGAIGHVPPGFGQRPP